jgi:hypothetical protein
MKELLTKIAKIQDEIGVLKKDTQGYNYKYTEINQILERLHPLLTKHKLLLLQPVSEGKLTTKVIDLESLEELTSEMELPKDVEPKTMGGAITYYRRYTLMALLSLQAEDDDGSSTTSKKDLKEKDLPF